MPNWCENDIEITGPKEDVNLLIEWVQGEEDLNREDGRIIFSFNSILPYPEEYKKFDAVAREFDMQVEAFRQVWLADHPVPDVKDEEAMKAWRLEWQVTLKDSALHWENRPKDGFNAGGYEWCVANWGTKWDASEPRWKEEPFEYNYEPDGKGPHVTCEYTFSTAWAPPHEVIAALAHQFSAVEIRHRYFEAGMAFNGMVVYENGEEASHEQGPYFGDRGG